MTTPSQYNCPECRSRLRHEIKDDGTHIVWCGVGRCPSYAANDGGSGRNELEAFKDLENKIDMEPEI